MTVFCIMVLGLLLFTAGGYLICLYPGKRQDMSPFTTVPIAHRGLHTEDAEAPENTLKAFQRAKEFGYAVELDIQFTADKKIVVFHDADLHRMCGADIRVDSLSYEELCAYTVQGSDQRIPLFTDVLALLQDTPLVCELKSYGRHGDTRLCEAVYPLLSNYSGAVCVESFNPMMIRWFYKNAPYIRRGILSMRHEKNLSLPVRTLLTALLCNGMARPHFIALRHTDYALPSFRLCRKLFHTPAIAWTVNTQREQEAALAHFDNVIFEQYTPVISKEETLSCN